MKPNINREVAIGLSLLGVLLVILAAVAVWRFSRPKVEAERMLAREEKREEKRDSQHPELPLDSPAKQDAVKRLEFPKHDGLQALDDPGHWKTAEKERKKEAREDSPPPESRKEQREQAKAVGAASVADGDDRYSIAVSPPADPYPPARSESMVVQVSGGEQADRAAADTGPVCGRWHSVAPVAEQLPHRDGASPGMVGADSEAARRHAEKAWEHGIQGDLPPANPPVAVDPYAHPQIPAARDDGRLGHEAFPARPLMPAQLHRTQRRGALLQSTVTRLRKRQRPPPRRRILQSPAVPGAGAERRHIRSPAERQLLDDFPRVYGAALVSGLWPSRIAARPSVPTGSRRGW